MFKAYFTYVTSGLTLSFINLSLGSPDTFVWTFGQGNGTSTQENPTFMYSSGGAKQVILAITKGSGSSMQVDSLALQVTVALTGTPLPNTIVGQLLSRFPWASDLTLVDPLIKKWQKYLCILLDPNIDETQAYNELIWPPLANELVLNLVLYDILTDRFLNIATTAIASSGSSGQLKSMVTGPSEAEWFDFSTSVYQLMKPGGLYDSLKARICVLSARLMVPIEFCPPLASPVFVPQIIRTKASSHLHTNFPHNSSNG